MKTIGPDLQCLQGQLQRVQQELAQSKGDMLQMAQKFKADQDEMLVKVAALERMVQSRS